MVQTQERISLGRYMQSLRVKKGLGLDEINRRTHVSKQNLIRLEADDHAGLPPSVHVKGFLKAYAEVLGIDPERVLQRYAEDLMNLNNLNRSYGFAGRFSFWIRLIFAFGLLSAVISLTFYSATLLSKPSKDAAEAIASGSEQDAALTGRNSILQSQGRGEDEAGSAPAVEDELSQSSNQKRLKLSITALEATQVKAIVDRQAPKTFNLKPEDRLELEASSHFNLLLDNAAGVKLYFNEKPVTLLGKAGQSVTIQLP